MTRLRVLVLMMSVALMGAPWSRAHAQEPSAPSPPTEQSGGGGLAAQDASAPPERSFHGSASASVGLASGIQSQRGFSVDASVTRPFADGHSFVASASRDYQKVTFPSESLLADRTGLAVGTDHSITARSILIVRSMYLRDTQLKIDARFEQLAGYGVRFADAERRIELQFVPGVSVYHEELGYAAPEGWKQGFGFFERLSVGLGPVWSVSNEFRFRRDFSDPHRSIESVADLTGMITRTVGVQLEYQFNYESLVPDGFPHYLSLLTAGLNFEF